MQRTLYHGSESIVEHPTFGVGNPRNDYGLAFYCTGDKRLAGEWAVRKSSTGYINKYRFRDDGLAILDLTRPPHDDVLEWVALLMANRSIPEELAQAYPRELQYLRENHLVDVRLCDMVIGYRADDAYFKFPESFIRSELTLQALRQIYRAGELGTQYAIVSQRAFDRLSFVGCTQVRGEARGDFYSRIDAANELHRNLLQEGRYAAGTRMIDLVRDR